MVEETHSVEKTADLLQVNDKFISDKVVSSMPHLGQELNSQLIAWAFALVDIKLEFYIYLSVNWTFFL